MSQTMRKTRKTDGSCIFNTAEYLTPISPKSREYTPIPNIVVRDERNKQEADDRKGLWDSPNTFSVLAR